MLYPHFSRPSWEGDHLMAALSRIPRERKCQGGKFIAPLIQQAGELAGTVDIHEASADAGARGSWPPNLKVTTRRLTSETLTLE